MKRDSVDPGARAGHTFRSEGRKRSKIMQKSRLLFGRAARGEMLSCARALLLTLSQLTRKHASLLILASVSLQMTMVAVCSFTNLRSIGDIPLELSGGSGEGTVDMTILLG